MWLGLAYSWQYLSTTNYVVFYSQLGTRKEPTRKQEAEGKTQSQICQTLIILLIILNIILIEIKFSFYHYLILY
jgi:hypothetical protein